MSIHINFMCNHLKLEATLKYINRWMDSQMLEYPHNGFCSTINKNELMLHSNIDGSQNNYAEL